MKQPIWNRRIPTMAGMFLLLALIGGTIALVKTGVLFPIRASGSDEPQAVQVSNVTDTSFTVSYTTDSPAVGSVTYGPTTTFGSVSLDVRDTAGNESQPHTIHQITVTHLQPQTTYQFGIISGSTTFTNNGSPYSISTAPSGTSTPDKQSPITGRVINPNGNAPVEAIVYLTAPDSQLLSELVKPDGTYSIPIDTLRQSQLATFLPINNETLFTLQFAGEGLTSSVKMTMGTSNPVPDVTLSQDYDFTQATVETPTPVASDSAQIGLPEFTSNKSVNTSPGIISPQKDQEYADQQPDFTGTAPPGRTVDIVIHSTDLVHATVKADQYGTWSYRPTKPLTPGTHTIEITTRDEAGLIRTITQSFVVHAEGSQFTEPSVAPTETPVPSQSPTKPAVSPTRSVSPTVPATATPLVSVSPSSTPSASPTAQATPTTLPTTLPTPTLLPTITPLPTDIATIPTQGVKPTISSPGSEDVVVTLSIAVVAMISGAVLFFLTQGGAL